MYEGKRVKDFPHSPLYIPPHTLHYNPWGENCAIQSQLVFRKKDEQ